MTELNYSEWLARSSVASRQTRSPIGATFELTPACNLRCHFCYVALDPYRGPYLTTEQCIRVLDTLQAAGVLLLTLTGGEVFSRKDFPAIYRAARARGFLVTIFTNATMIDEADAEMLREEPPHSVEVSIYGADAEHYEAVTAIRGSFAKFERGISLLQSAGVVPLMKHPISNLTEDHVDAIRGWCEARRLPHKFSTEIERRHDGGDAPTVYRIETRRAQELKDHLFEAKTGGQRGLPLAECVSIPRAPGEPETLYQCGAGKLSLFVDALGQASHCVIDREPAFPILTMPWPELWQQMQAWVNQPLPADAPCSGCSLRSGCNNCPARARLATGSPYGRDDYQCTLTHAEFGVERPAPRAASRPLGACVA